jgi:Tol biopolymer transport system component
MRQVNPSAGDSRVLGKGSPFYWVWSPQGDRILVHVGGSRALSDGAHISILKEEGAQRIELNLAPGGFQAPQWSSDGTNIFYIAANDRNENAIYQMNPDTLEQTRLTRLDGFAFMVLSPDDTQIAYVQIEAEDRPPFGTAYIVGTDGRNHRRLTDRPVGSIYWSPDGSKLALLSLGRQEDGATAKAGGLAAPLPQELVLRWLILNVETGELELLTSFSPTLDFLQTVPYFDQYHLSLTFWSPDSRYLVVTKKEADRDQGIVWVYDTTGREEPRQIGAGTLAVWSWQ